MNRFVQAALVAASVVIVFTDRPLPLTAQERPAPQLRPSELRAAQLASRWVLGAQQQEREIAAGLNAKELVREVVRLRGAIRALKIEETAALLGAQAPPHGTGGPSEAADLSQRRQQLLQGADQLAERHRELRDQASSVASARQRRVALAVAEKLESVEHALRDALSLAPEERIPRLDDLEARLAVDGHTLTHPGSLPPQAPILRLEPVPDLPPLEILDEPR